MKVNENKKRRKKVDSPFSRNLRQVLEERGISIRAAAELCGEGVSPSVISDWCNGTVPHDLRAVQRLCKSLRVSFEWLLTGEVTTVESRDLSLAEIFEEKDTGFQGIFKVSATRLVRRGENEK